MQNCRNANVQHSGRCQLIDKRVQQNCRHFKRSGTITATGNLQIWPVPSLGKPEWRVSVNVLQNGKARERKPFNSFPSEPAFSGGVLTKTVAGDFCALAWVGVLTPLASGAPGEIAPAIGWIRIIWE